MLFCSTFTSYDREYQTLQDNINTLTIKSNGGTTQTIIIIGIILVLFIFYIIYDLFIYDISRGHTKLKYKQITLISAISIAIIGILLIIIGSISFLNNLSEQKNLIISIQNSITSNKNKLLELKQESNKAKQNIKNNYLIKFQEFIPDIKVYEFINKSINNLKKLEDNSMFLVPVVNSQEFIETYEEIILAIDNYQFLFLKEKTILFENLFTNIKSSVDSLTVSLQTIYNNLKPIIPNITIETLEQELTQVTGDLKNSYNFFIDNFNVNVTTYKDIINNLEELTESKNTMLPSKTLPFLLNYISSNSILVGNIYEQLVEQIKIFIPEFDSTNLPQFILLFEDFKSFLIDIKFQINNPDKTLLKSEDILTYVSNWEDKFKQQGDFLDKFMESFFAKSVLQLKNITENTKTLMKNLEVFHTIPYNSLSEVLNNQIVLFNKHKQNIELIEKYLSFYGPDIYNNLALSYEDYKSIEQYIKEKQLNIPFDNLEKISNSIFLLMEKYPDIYDIASQNAQELITTTQNLNPWWIINLMSFTGIDYNIYHTTNFLSSLEDSLKYSPSQEVFINGINKKIIFPSFYTTVYTEVKDLDLFQYLDLMKSYYISLIQFYNQYQTFLSTLPTLSVGSVLEWSSMSDQINQFNNSFFSQYSVSEDNQLNILSHARTNMNELSQKYLFFGFFSSQLPKLSGVYTSKFVPVYDLEGFSLENILNTPMVIGSSSVSRYYLNLFDLYASYLMSCFYIQDLKNIYELYSVTYNKTFLCNLCQMPLE